MKDYLLIETGACDEARYCGAYIHGEYETLDEAKAALHETARGWVADGQVACDPDEWQPGYCSDPESSKYADEFWHEGDLTAWRGMDGRDWVKLEIAEHGDDGWHVI